MLNTRKALIVFLTSLMLMILPATPATSIDQDVEVMIQTHMELHYAYLYASYTLIFKGPSKAQQVVISLEGMAPSASTCQGTKSTRWTIDIPQLAPNATYNITVNALWPISIERLNGIINVPLNPKVSTRISSVHATLKLTNYVSNIKIRNLNYTLTNDVIQVDVLDIPPYEVRTLNAQLIFNTTTAPRWLFKIHKLIRVIDVSSYTSTDYITIEGLYGSLARRQEVFNFEFSGDITIIEVGDLAGTFRISRSTPGYAQYHIVRLNESTILQIHPRVSLAKGERTTIYIKYKLNKEKPITLMPLYAYYVDSLEVRVQVPEGSVIENISPHPNSTDNSLIIYSLSNASILSNPIITVKYNPPLIPPIVVPYLVLVITITAVVIATLHLKKHLIKTKPKTRYGTELKKLQELFNSYVESSRRMWRLHEDYLKDRVKNSTYRKRLRELKPSYMDCMKKLIELANTLERIPQMSRLVQRISSHIEKAMKLEEEMSKLHVIKRSKKVARTELAKKIEELKKEIEKLKDETRELNFKISRAIT